MAVGCGPVARGSLCKSTTRRSWNSGTRSLSSRKRWPVAVRSAVPWASSWPMSGSPVKGVRPAREGQSRREPEVARRRRGRRAHGRVASAASCAQRPRPPLGAGVGGDVRLGAARTRGSGDPSVCVPILSRHGLSGTSFVAPARADRCLTALAPKCTAGTQVDRRHASSSDVVVGCHGAPPRGRFWRRRGSPTLEVDAADGRPGPAQPAAELAPATVTDGRQASVGGSRRPLG